MRVLKIVIVCVLMLICVSAQAKKEKGRRTGEPPEVAGTLGSSLLLIGTSSAATIENILKGVESLSRETVDLSPQERDFLFGYANYRLGKWSEAEAFFKKCGDLPVIDDHILFYRARTALALGDNEKADVLFTKILEEKNGSVWTNEARRYGAEAKINFKRFEDARRLIEQYIKNAPLASDVFDANLLLARSYMAQGDEAEAAAHLRRMASNAVSESELAELARLGNSSFERWLKDPSVQVEIAQSLMDHSQWTDALNHLEKAMSSRSDFETKWFFARSLFRAHRYKEVIPLLEELLKEGGGQMRLTLLNNLASAYARVDDYKHSIELRKKIIHEYSNMPGTVLDSQSKIAFLLLDDGHYKEAVDEFENVLRLKGSAGMRTKVLWYMAWSYYQMKEYDSAVRIMNDLLKGGARKGKVKMDDRVAYWKARSLEKAGRREEARSIYRQILGSHPIGYYGVLSRRRLDGDVRNTRDFSEAPAHRWPAGHFKQEIPDARGVYQASPHLARAIVFDRLKLHEEAARELSVAVSSERFADANLVMWLASKNFAHNISYVFASQRYASFLHSLPDADGFQRFVWEQSYPESYKPVVEKLVGGSFDPKIVYAIMRAESNFRPAVVSPAGAVGLMQLMPVTAQKMAEQSGDNGFDAHSLYRPAKNIEYGVQYLKKLHGLFPNNAVAVIASYNAGEEAVGRWVNHGYSPDIEEFIEEIPYDETNLYVKKVMMSYWILQQMY